MVFIFIPLEKIESDTKPPKNVIPTSDKSGVPDEEEEKDNAVASSEVDVHKEEVVEHPQRAKTYRLGPFFCLNGIV